MQSTNITTKHLERSNDVHFPSYNFGANASMSTNTCIIVIIDLCSKVILLVAFYVSYRNTYVLPLFILVGDYSKYPHKSCSSNKQLNRHMHVFMQLKCD